MDFLELAKNRFSLRKFSDKKVEKEKIDYILAAMQAAPTAVNFQPQRILVLTDEKELEKVSKCTKFAFNPPLNFSLYVTTKKHLGRAEMTDTTRVKSTRLSLQRI